MDQQTQPPDTAHNMPTFTVGELSATLKKTIEDRFAVVRVRGEISQAKVVGSGHCYLRLKDANAVLDGVIWRSALWRLGLKPEDGLEVICTGRLTTYPGRSSYQIIIERMELAGEGALLKMIEERRKRLAAEGLFDEERKRPLPFLPEVIGVVTSPTGAVIRDILHRLNDRFPRRVLLWPVKVQGEEAARQVATAIAGIDRLTPGGAVPRPDVVIVARGGGSLEDLMPFNEEEVVRAAASCRIPLISAVGHETDTTLIDHAADRRAPTPTAAAEMAVPVRTELLVRVEGDGARLVAGMARTLADGRREVQGLARGLPDPRSLMEFATQRLDDFSERLRGTRFLEQRSQQVRELGLRLPDPKQYVEQRQQRLAGLSNTLRALQGKLADTLRRDKEQVGTLADRLLSGGRRYVTERTKRLESQANLLDGLSYERVLDRGFTLVRDNLGAPITSSRGVAADDRVVIQFRDGRVGALIGDRARGQRAISKLKKQAKTKVGGSDAQGDLL